MRHIVAICALLSTVCFAGGYSSPSRSSSSFSSGRSSYSSPTRSTSSYAKPSYTPARSIPSSSYIRNPVSKETYSSKASATTPVKLKTSFASEPEVRPAYIPKTAVIQGKPHNIVYNNTTNSYGYWLLGAWVAYEVYTNGPPNQYEEPPTVKELEEDELTDNEDSDLMWFVALVFMLFFVVAGILYYDSKLR